MLDGGKTNKQKNPHKLKGLYRKKLLVLIRAKSVRSLGKRGFG
jgi:hypothetical protein